MIDVKRFENRMNRGGKFLKKLWCCVGRQICLDNLVLSTDSFALTTG